MAQRKNLELLADANGVMTAYWCNATYYIRLPETVIGRCFGKNGFLKNIFQKLMMGSFIFSKFADFKGFLEVYARFKKALDVFREHLSAFEWLTR